jgi:hypothetical protein
MRVALLITVTVATALAGPSGSCQSAPSKIVLENALPGTSSDWWDVNGAGSEEVQGFSTRASVLPGAEVSFKIKQALDEPLRVDIYRMGWYGGDGARKVGEATLTDTKMTKPRLSQPDCLRVKFAVAGGKFSEPDESLVDCGNWAVAARFTVSANATSGLYFARMTLTGPDPKKRWRADASPKDYDANHAMIGYDPKLPPMQGRHAYGSLGKDRLRAGFRLREPRASHAFFVVRDADVAAAAGSTASVPESGRMLFQTIDTTWHAYNGYGGLTTYGSFEYPFYHGPDPTPYNLSLPGHDLKRAYKRSYNTPLITRNYRAVNQPFGNEYPAIRFLERNGYELHYCTAADLGVPSRARKLLRGSSAYLSVGHDEYWSYEQREAVEAARDEGVHLNFWSANEAYWAVRFEASPVQEGSVGVDADDAAEDAPRTMIVFKETQSSVKLDPQPGAWTGTFRDDRSINPRGGMPENALSGTMFAANAHRSDSIVVDGGRFGGHRAWRGTSIASMRLGDPPKALLFGMLGHEWNHDVDNGWRPPALQTLSETTVDNVQMIMDWGATFDSASPTHSIVLHRRGNGSGPFVFGAATVQWAWGLDNHHDLNDPQRQNKYDIRVTKCPHGTSHEAMQLTVNVLADMGLVPATLERSLMLPPPSTDATPPDAGVSTHAAAKEVADGDDEGRFVVRASGWATDSGGGVVASVEVSWDGGVRYHPASIDILRAETTWSFVWGDDPWQLLHGDLPKKSVLEGQEKLALVLRVSDDSGNLAVVHV